MSRSILVIRLGAMGDIIHALPAVQSLKQSFPSHWLRWLVAPKWMPLLEGNPSIDELVPFDRSGFRPLKNTLHELCDVYPERAIDFQGLLQSAIAGRLSRPELFFGLNRTHAREPLASLFYNRKAKPTAEHVVEINLQLAEAAGARNLTNRAWIPPGREEGTLPHGAFVLANPFAGWAGKEWPVENYEALAQRLKPEGLALVTNVPAHRATELSRFGSIHVHVSSLAGLIAATRRATAVVGLDSGPLHLAAALHKPGVALFGPTNPARNGPYGGTIDVIRAAQAVTTYKRSTVNDPSMREISVEQVATTLLQSIASHRVVLEPGS